MKRLLMFTHQYPYNQSEAFIESEIHFLSSKFDEIILFPINVSSDKVELTRAVPGNVQICHLNDYQMKQGSIKRLLRFLNVLFDGQSIKWLIRELNNIKPHGIRGFLIAINWLSIARVLRDTVLNKLKSNNQNADTIMYSYWQNTGALGGIMIKNHLNIPIVSRAHGGDLYRERHKPAYIPFQVNVIKQLDQLYVISKNGHDYLTDIDNTLEEKIEVSRLGIINNGMKAYSSQDGILRIVTCAYMVPVKRLHLLIEALHKVNSKVEWRHIGSGPLESELNQLAKELPSNVVVKFLGNLSNKEVLENYSNEPTDLFINVSELEGIPVSIMEAFSCSIPVIATNVGGTSELVNDKNGILISKDVTPDELASFIDEFYNLNEDEKQVKSREAYEMWNNNYNAEKNYEEFASKLMNMMGLLHER